MKVLAAVGGQLSQPTAILFYYFIHFSLMAPPSGHQNRSVTSDSSN